MSLSLEQNYCDLYAQVMRSRLIYVALSFSFSTANEMTTT